MLYFYGIRIGVGAILRGRASREAVKNVIVPENYWRTLENRLTYDELRATSADRILDVGSPKLLSLFLADRVGAEVYSTDIESYFMEDYASFRRMRRIPESRFRVMKADGRKLPFPDAHFTRIYSISVLEHIPGDGDSECMQEVARTMKPGALCVLTVPFAPDGRNEYRDADAFYWSGNSEGSAGETRVFYQRRYSEQDLLSRLVAPSGLRLFKTRYLGDRVAFPGGKEVAEYFPPLTGPLHPLVSKIFHAPPSPSWKGMKKPLGALLVLRKD